MKVVYSWLKEFVEVKASRGRSARAALAGGHRGGCDRRNSGRAGSGCGNYREPSGLPGAFGNCARSSGDLSRSAEAISPELKEIAEKVSGVTRVEIEAPELCGRFTARVIRGVKVQPSPDWLRQRLEAIGEKSINNVVDVTNYVMFELGHPLHAFDFDKLAEHRLIVRRAQPGEKLKTLDGGEYKLTKDMCVIADAQHAVSIGRSDGRREFGDFLQHENDPDRMRVVRSHRRYDGASKALGLRSEASYRFERGADPEMAELASRRAAELIQQVAGGEILAGVVDVYPQRETEKKIELSRKELLRVMGADVPDRDIEQILSALGFHAVRVDSNRGSDGSIAAIWECRAVSWRQDVTRGIDLIEEVARHYGYDKFPPRLPPAKIAAHRLPHAEAQDRLRERIVALGYQEIVEIPIVDTKRDELFREEGWIPAMIGNPLAEDAAVMRSSGTVSMLRAIEWNLNHGQRDLRLFEIGKTYELRNGEPVETQVLTLGVTGAAREKTIHEAAREF